MPLFVIIKKKEEIMMMDYGTYQNMMGGGAGIFMWLTYILVIAVLVLGAVALWKYINKG